MITLVATYEYETHRLSNGFILAISASDVTTGANYRARLMQGFNHLQMKNDENMRDAVNFIFERGMGEFQNGYFYTAN